MTKLFLASLIFLVGLIIGPFADRIDLSLADQSLEKMRRQLAETQALLKANEKKTILLLNQMDILELKLKYRK